MRNNVHEKITRIWLVENEWILTQHECKVVTRVKRLQTAFTLRARAILLPLKNLLVLIDTKLDSKSCSYLCKHFSPHLLSHLPFLVPVLWSTHTQLRKLELWELMTWSDSSLMSLKPLIILIPWSTSFHNVEYYVNFFFQFLDLGRLRAVLAFWRSPSRELKKVTVKIKLMLACHAELWEWGAGNISCVLFVRLSSRAPRWLHANINFFYYFHLLFFFYFARRTSPKSRDYS